MSEKPNVNKPFFLWSYVAGIALSLPFTLGALIAGEGVISEDEILISLVGSIFSLYSFVIFFMLIYKMWKMIPAENARTIPEKAVGFLFIPVYSVYWCFIAIRGWAQDWNAYAKKSKEEILTISEALALSIAIFIALSGSIGAIANLVKIPWTSFILSIPFYILVPFFINKICDCLNSAPAVTVEEKTVSASGSTAQKQDNSLSVASLVLGIVSVVLPYLGTFVGIAAIVCARKQRRIFPDSLSLAGLITGIIGTVLWGFAIIAVIIIVAVQT